MNDLASSVEPSIEPTPTPTAPRRKPGPKPGPRASAPTPRSPVTNTYGAAYYCGFSQWALRVWRRKNKGPQFVKVGRTVKYRISDLDAWLASHVK